MIEEFKTWQKVEKTMAVLQDWIEKDLNHSLLMYYYKTSPGRELLAEQIYKMRFNGDSIDKIFKRIEKARKRRIKWL